MNTSKGHEFGIHQHGNLIPVAVGIASLVAVVLRVRGGRASGNEKSTGRWTPLDFSDGNTIMPAVVSLETRPVTLKHADISEVQAS